ncbi:MAG: nucleotidyltransferase family protein [bacterium]
MGKAIIDETKLQQTCKKYDVTFLGVFGSYARDHFTRKSDLDLLVRFSKRKSLLDLVGIEMELSEELGIKVDLLTEKSISPYLRDKIMKELKVVYDEKR